jgi:hypothetical protein
MHNNAHGMGGKHIWPELQRHVNDLRGEAIEKVNHQFVPMLLIKLYLMNFRMSALPRWKDLAHFERVMTTEFSDANKFEAILKVCNLSLPLSIFLFMIP